MANSDVKLKEAWPSSFMMRPRIALNIKSVEYKFLEENQDPKASFFLNQTMFPICESLVTVYVDEDWSSCPFILPSDPYDRAIARFWAAYLDEKWFPSMRSIAATKKGRHERR
ncbi:unnamed protein product [Dovyalis caffra]|uniref:Glutathione S-transferase n=1 Tax=Dovyalis caffra TaxID=77055 RepID=A0AAV1S1F8_9ROSI|nr:unnamed protein product [Dovyalis caffra]